MLKIDFRICRKAITIAVVLFLSSVQAQDNSDREHPPTLVTEKTVLKNPNFTGAVPKVRLKDITHFSGVRENQLVGYGLVVGLNGSGDTLASSPYTRESLISMLERLGVNIRDTNIPSGKSIAAVMVTASLPPFSRQGSKIDVTVSAVGDAKDLRGGTLLVTPLLGADGEVYAVAQGAVAVSGFFIQGRASSATKGVPTSGKIANGAIVEREVGFELSSLKALQLTLNNPDFTTAQRISTTVNEHLKKPLARAIDSSTVHILSNPQGQTNMMNLMTEIEQLMVEPDQTARIVIDDQNGVIVIGHNVKINPIALTHGTITVRIAELPQVSQPNSFTNVTTGNAPINVGTPNVANNNQQINNAAIFSDQAKALDTQQKADKITLTNQQQQQINLFYQQNGLGRAPNDQTKYSLGSDSVYQGLPSPRKVAISTQFAALQQQQNLQMQQLDQNHQQQISQLQQQQQIAGTLQNQQQLNNLNPQASVQLIPVQQATITDKTIIKVKEEKGKFTSLESGANLGEFVDALNSLGVSPKDMTAIFQSIKAAGALQAEISVM
jgi:flagellar P-ring protein precursor FlgI